MFIRARRATLPSGGKAAFWRRRLSPASLPIRRNSHVPGSDGKVLERRGFIALGGLHDYGEKVVFRHEQTLSKPKSDRLNLLRATRAHFGQIFMLYSDPGLTAEKLLFNEDATPDIEVTDEYDVLHRVWKISDENTINILDQRTGGQEADHRRRTPSL